MKISKITFSNDINTCKYMMAMFPDLKKECIACGKKVTPKNIGGITHKGYIHNNIVCLIEYTESEKKK
jgi:hypothetical protein